MAEMRLTGGSPVARHTSTPRELKQRLAAERTGAAHLIFRDSDAALVIHVLDGDDGVVAIGRGEQCDVRLHWDVEVSRQHAQLELVGGQWTLADEGLSRNGSFVNGDRLQGRRRLSDGDELRFGRTIVVFRAPSGTTGGTTRPGGQITLIGTLSETDRRLLDALCRPLRGRAHALPAGNREIADELCLSVPAVKKRLGILFMRFGLGDLPQSEKRTRLALEALERGIVSGREL